MEYSLVKRDMPRKSRSPNGSINCFRTHNTGPSL